MYVTFTVYTTGLLEQSALTEPEDNQTPPPAFHSNVKESNYLAECSLSFMSCSSVVLW